MRDAHLDRAKFLLIALVVFGHGLEKLHGGPLGWAAYLAVYAFHVPAFAFLSGHFTRATLDARALRRIAFGIVCPYLFFQLLYTFAFGSRITFVLPYWLLWYLVSLAAWRLMLPLFVQLRGALAISLGLALVAGLFPDVGSSLSLSRTLVFFPLFLLGHQLRESGLSARLSGRKAQLGAAVVFALLLAASWEWRALPAFWLYGSHRYAQMRIPWEEAVLFRLGQLTVSAVVTLAFLTLVPRGQGRLARWGERSFSAYLLHGFLILWIAPWLRQLPGLIGTPLAIAALLSGALALTALLSTRWVERLAAPLVAPSWLEGLLCRRPVGGSAGLSSG